MSVDSGLGPPGERRGESARAPAAAARGPVRAPRAPAGRGPDRSEALADAVATADTGRRGRAPRQGRRVRRVLRRVELWSVLKVSLVFYAVMLGVVLGAVALLWALANTTGLVDDLEGFLRDSGFEDFRFEGDQMFRQVAFLGAVAALALTVFTVLAAALVNLISEVTGGIRLVIIEEIVDTPAAPAPAAAPVATAAPPPTLPARPASPSPFPDVDPPRPTPARPPSGPPAAWPPAPVGARGGAPAGDESSPAPS